jgi:hypothetical protein
VEYIFFQLVNTRRKKKVNNPLYSPLEGYTQNPLNSKPEKIEKENYIKFLLESNKQRIGQTISLKQTNKEENNQFTTTQGIGLDLQALQAKFGADKQAKLKTEREQKEKAREEESYKRLKDNYDQMKISMIQELQKKEGLITKDCRQAVLLELIIQYHQMKNQICHATNHRFLERLKEFGFEISERTLQNDLKELADRGLIKIKVFTEKTHQGQYMSERHIRQNEEFINTFFRVEVIMDSISYFIRRIYDKVSNKLKAAKTYLQDGIKRLNKVAEIKKLQKRKGNGIPFDLGEVVSYFIEELRKPASKAVDFFNWHSKNNWYDSGGKPINSWRGIAQVWV